MAANKNPRKKPLPKPEDLPEGADIAYRGDGVPYVRFNRTRSSLSEQQRLLVDAYFATNGNETQAAELAGYANAQRVGIAKSLFRTPAVAVEVERRRRRLTDKAELTMERIVEEYKKVAFSSVGDLIEVNEDGTAFIDMRRMDDETRAAISEFSTDIALDKTTGGEVLKMKVKLHDKLTALNALTRIMGGFNDKLTVDVEVSLTDRLAKGRERARLIEAPVIDVEPSDG